MIRSTTVAVMAGLTALTIGSPLELLGTERMSVAQIRNLTLTADQQMMNIYGCDKDSCLIADTSGSTGRSLTMAHVRQILAAAECRGQSCLIADTSGSTGRTPTMKAQGASDSDIACIVRHNPELAELLRKYKNSPPDGPAQDTTFVTSLMQGINGGSTGATETGTFDGTCATNILIYAKGTFEPGVYGVFVGPSFTSGLPSGWSTAGVSYDVNVGGDFCLGTPGGMVAKDLINGAHQKCPNSNLFVSGYSQGAMAIRNGLARASPAAVAKVKGVITFGDPFNGAPIKGYNGPIKIFCNDGDGVCTGNFELRPAHLSYGFDTSAGLAQTALLDMARGIGDESCCRPKVQPPLPSPEQWAQSIAKNGGRIPKPIAGTSIDTWAQAISESNGNVPKYTDPNSGAKPINLGLGGVFGGLFG